MDTEITRKDPKKTVARQFAAELKALAFKLLRESYDSREEFTADLHDLASKATALDEVLKDV